MRLAAQSKGGYYPTPDRVVDMIAGLIDTPYGYHHYNRETLRILDPLLRGRGRRGAACGGASPPGGPPRRDLRRGASPGQGATGGEGGSTAPSPPTCSPPPSPTGPSASPTSTRHTTGTRRTSASSTPSSPTAPATWPRAGCWSSSFPASAWRCRPATCPPTTGTCAAGPSRTREREVFDQVVLLGYRKADPIPDASAEETVNRWSEGDLDRLGGGALPLLQGPRRPLRETSCSPPAPSIPSRLRRKPGGRGCGPARR